MALKGIEKVEAKFCVQTAVYWGNPQPNGYGGFTYDDPIELSPSNNNGVRWEDVREVDMNYDGRVAYTKASVLVLQDLDEQGYLYLGSLSDLTAAQKANPKSIKKAYQIHRFDKIPMVFKTDEFIRTAWLYDQGK